MRINRSPWLLISILPLLMTACQNQDAGSSDQDAFEYRNPPVANVRGVDVPDEVFQAFLRRRNKMNADPAEREQLLRELIDLYLLQDIARSSGILDRSTLRADIDLQQLSMVANTVMSEHRQQNPVTEEEIRAEYDLTIARVGDQEYRVSHILVPELDAAESIISRLDQGESFKDIMAEKAAEVGAANASDLGWVNLAQVPPTMVDSLKAMAVGTYSEAPARSDYGYHVVLLEETRPLELVDYDSVKEGIRQSLQARRSEDYLRTLRGENPQDDS